MKVQELLDNNIYPVTLAQKNDLFPFSKKDSNILLNIKLDPIIIDVDGRSTFYSDKFVESKYNLTLGSLTKLILEILTNRDLSYELLDDYPEEYYQILSSIGIDKKISKKYYDYTYIDMDDINKILKK